MGSVFIQSVDRAFRILEYISANSSAGISEISRALDLNKSTTFGLVKTLETLGYVLKSESDDKYLISYKLYSLSKQSIDTLPIIDIVKSYLVELNNKYGETIHLVASTDNSVIYIDKIDSTQSISVSTKIGQELPLHSTGVGKAILSLRSNEQVKIYADTYGLETFTRNTITNKFDLIEEIENVKKNGYSIDNEEIQEGLYCIAIPLQTSTDDYALSISMPKFRINDDLKNKIIEDLLNIKEKILKIYTKKLDIY